MILHPYRLVASVRAGAPHEASASPSPEAAGVSGHGGRAEGEVEPPVGGGGRVAGAGRAAVVQALLGRVAILRLRRHGAAYIAK